MHLILASASPRRADLLSAAGFRFQVQPVEVDETPRPGEAPVAYVERLAVEKALRIACQAGETAVLAADTAVVVDGLILGKPVDDQDAARMLAMLSGRQHEVLTGVALRFRQRIETAVESSRVCFLEMSPAEIDWYVASAEPRDKAGAYAIQGLASRYVDRIEGSYSNIVGLPIARAYRLLRDAGVA